MDIKEIIEEVEERLSCETYKYFHYGEKYYKSRNSNIEQRKKKVYLGEQYGITENPFASNHRISSGFFKKIVVQKVMYLLGKGVKFINAQQSDDINNYFYETFDEMIIKAGKLASKKSEAWLYAFMDNGSLKFRVIDPEYLIPIYDEFDNLVLMIKKYEKDEYTVIEVYDENEVKIYHKKNKEIGYKLFNTIGHYSIESTFNGDIVGEPIQHGFGMIPFIPLYNNEERISDLYPIKYLIDVYDIINSDFANNIDDMQDAFFTLKGFSGDKTKLGEFMRQLKMIKAVPVAQDGEVSANQLEIPVTARKTFLELLKESIYEYSMSVDTKQLTGSSITNVYIRAMFADLDLKCDEFESEVRKFIYQIIDFINYVDNKKFDKTLKFERSLIINRVEAIDSLIKLTGTLSKETQLELLPYDIDVEQELQRLQDESMGISLEGTLNNLNGTQ